MAVTVCFLDFDGVLNCATTRQTFNDLKGFDPEMVGRLNQICRLTDAWIVVSSSWRIGRTLADLQRILHTNGCTAPVIDKTPMLTARQDGSLYISLPRSEEIKSWLADHPEATRWFAIDDEQLEGIPQILTTWTRGLEDGHIRLAARMVERWRAA